MSNKLLTLSLLGVTILCNQVNASNNINNNINNIKNDVINECFMMTENDKKDLMELEIEDYDIKKEGEEIVKQIDYFKDKNGEYTIKKDNFFYDCKKVWPENEYMSLLDIAKKYNMNMQDVIQSYNQAYFYNSAIPSEKVLFGDVINYTNEGNNTMLDAAIKYSINLRAIDDMYGKLVYLNKDGQYVSNEEILAYIYNKKIKMKMDNSGYVGKINQIARHFNLSYNIVLNMIRKVSVLNNGNEYITYFDILNEIEHSKKTMSEIAGKFNLDLNTVQQIYKSGTILINIFYTVMIGDIINSLSNNYTFEQIANDICRNQGEKDRLKIAILEVEHRYNNNDNKVKKIPNKTNIKTNKIQNFDNIQNDIINCINGNEQLYLSDISQTYKISLKQIEKIFRNIPIKNNNQQNILIGDILNYLYDRNNPHTIQETLSYFNISNTKILTDTSYILNNKKKYVDVNDIRNRILHDSTHNILNLKNIANSYHIKSNIVDIIFRTIIVKGSDNKEILIDNILNYIIDTLKQKSISINGIVNYINSIYSSNNQVLNQQSNNNQVLNQYSNNNQSLNQQSNNNKVLSHQGNNNKVLNKQNINELYSKVIENIAGEFNFSTNFIMSLILDYSTIQ